MNTCEQPGTSRDRSRAESSSSPGPGAQTGCGPSAPQPGHQIARQALTVKEFCAAHGIGRTTFYELLRDGVGPRLMNVSGRTRISAEAAELWRREREVAAQQAAATRTDTAKKDRAREGGGR